MELFLLQIPTQKKKNIVYFRHKHAQALKLWVWVSIQRQAEIHIMKKQRKNIIHRWHLFLQHHFQVLPTKGMLYHYKLCLLWEGFLEKLYWQASAVKTRVQTRYLPAKIMDMEMPYYPNQIRELCFGYFWTSEKPPFQIQIPSSILPQSFRKKSHDSLFLGNSLINIF